MDKMNLSWTLIAQIIMFLIAMGVLSRFLFKPMLAVFEKRRRITDGPKQEADSLKQDAVAAQQQVEQTMKATRAEVDRLRDELLGSAQTTERDIVGEARQQAGKIAAEAQEELDQAVAQARDRLAKEAESLAEQLAGKLLRA
ncbi:MAG: ATP synthase F0 subunit B [Alphaproteobacteria bacterium]